ncbi:MAG: hypothetical protein GEU94_02105 [Micromonosporaceae bacterium]|nr:hypothetical protein [Micromonosporaceae bacterium]
MSSAQTSRLPWYVWLLIPLTLAGVVLVHGALVETPPTAPGAGPPAARRSGSLPRLLGWLKAGLAARRDRP